MFRKLLIANRGEIATRIIRACSELGITSAAIYTEPDRFALHVKKADEAYSVGPDPLLGYLNAHRIVNLAVETGCDALHPGYGFLSEHPELAEICQRRGVAYIGPEPESIRRMGDKTLARQTMQAAGLPVVPGTDQLGSLEEALGAAASIGYPVMLKASGGGGGRGIRRCNDPQELRRNYQRVISEAEKAFGNPEIFLEKFIESPRHIEVQILGDRQGNIVHLFERDCSIQRRHQKLIEIAPSPQLSPEQRDQVCRFGVAAARAANYINAGTVEFLLDQDGRFYFMEMNTRLQVEHPVTEQVTGIDIVQEQICIAAGQPLSFGQQDISLRGYAIEFRINAEDPKNNFLPSFGRVTRYYSPGGPGVRTDAAIYTGYEILPYYDSLCAKLTVWARDWDGVLRRSRRALKDMGLYGIRSTLPYYQEILDCPEFVAGRLDTTFVDRHPELLQYTDQRTTPVAVIVAAAIAAREGL
ncbi:acetyl-CoA carboxylase biotin carboxylase subunit [Thermithiobacillus plumbiphilus]|uniref:Acetyl-CoA carboxylase biotin carboxylase subunit n=1 Tax=Thermithiobacillus plumbiphilus TaxID=1729899 RepID=A0ABU9D4E7_9PROT